MPSTPVSRASLSKAGKCNAHLCTLSDVADISSISPVEATELSDVPLDDEVALLSESELCIGFGTKADTAWAPGWSWVTARHCTDSRMKLSHRQTLHRLQDEVNVTGRHCTDSRMKLSQRQALHRLQDEVKSQAGTAQTPGWSWATGRHRLQDESDPQARTAQAPGWNWVTGRHCTGSCMKLSHRQVLHGLQDETDKQAGTAQALG